MTGCRMQDGGEQEHTAGFSTMTVGRSDIVLEQSYPASVEGRQSIKIIPRIEGYLSEIRIKEGQRVKKGQILFVIDQATYLADVKAAEANLAVAKAGVENARLSYDSRQNLHSKGIVSDFDLQTAATNLAMAEAQEAQAEAQLTTARTNLSFTELRSPSDGVAGALPYRTGDYVGPGIQDGLTTIADCDEMYVYFSLSERDVMSRMEQYGSLDKTVEAFPPVSLQLITGGFYSVKGHVESISGVVESNTGALAARAVFDNTDGRLLSGSTARIVIPEELKQVIVIPQTATYEIQDKVFVYKVMDGKAHSQLINVMPVSDGINYVVTGGLTEGDVIIAKGAGYVKEGQEISIQTGSER